MMHVVVDAGERADVAVDDAGVFADDGRAADDTVDDLGAASTVTRPSTLLSRSTYPSTRCVNSSSTWSLASSMSIGLAGVDPPAAVNVRVDADTVVDQPLDGVGDLEFAAPAGLDAVDGLEDRGGRTCRCRPAPGCWRGFRGFSTRRTMRRSSSSSATP